MDTTIQLVHLSDSVLNRDFRTTSDLELLFTKPSAWSSATTHRLVHLSL